MHVIRRFGREAEFCEFLVALLDFGEQRTGSHRHNGVLRHSPAELLDNLKAHALRAFRVIRPHVDVHKGPAVFARDFRAEPVHFVVVAFDPDDFRAVNQRIHHLALLKVGRNEYVGFQSGCGGVRGDGVGEIAGRSAGDRGETQLARATQGHADDAVFERQRRIIDRIVLYPELAHAESAREPVGFDERRETDLKTDGRFARHGQQFAVAPHRLRSRFDDRPTQGLLDAVVVVNNFERSEVKFAHVRGSERIFASALTALERLHETCVFFHNIVVRQRRAAARPGLS